MDRELTKAPMAGNESAEAPQEPDRDSLDGANLKRAMKAFRKRLKLTRLGEESKLSRSPLTSGKKSSVVAIMPPHQYPREVWDELVRLGRLKGAGSGFYELVE